MFENILLIQSIILIRFNISLLKLSIDIKVVKKMVFLNDFDSYLEETILHCLSTKMPQNCFIQPKSEIKNMSSSI